jgi:hypothetical protein
MLGFLSHDWLARSALSTEWRHGIEIAVVLIGLIAALSSTPQPAKQENSQALWEKSERETVETVRTSA